jgi:hypothetical protein
VKHLTGNQMFGARHTAGQSPRQKSLPIYISWYINDYGRPWASLDVNPRIRPVYGQIAGTGGVLLATTDQMAAATFPRPISIHAVVPAARALSASRCDGASATRAPDTTTSTAARRGNGAGAGSSGREVRALCVPYRGDIHGLSRLITVSRNCRSGTLSCPSHVVPKLTINCTRLRRASAPGWPRAGP